MQFCSRSRLAALAAVGLALPALAAVSIELRSGNRVRGTFEAGGEAEVYLLDIPAQAVLTVKLKRAKKGPPPTLVLRDSEGADVSGEQVVEKRNAALLRRFSVPATGRYRLEVSARDGASAGDYALSVKWKSPRKYGVADRLDEGDLEIPFAADGGARLSAKLKAGKGSSLVPRVTRIEGPDDFVLSFDAGKAAVARVKQVELPATGEYALFVTDESAVGGELSGNLKLKQPRSRASVDLSAQLIQDGDGDTAAVGRIVTPEGAVLDVSALAGDDDGLRDLLGTILDIPPGSLPSATPVVIATSADLQPRVSGGRIATPGGPAVNFGPDGLRFDRPITVTLPLDPDAAADPDSVVVFTQSGRRRPEQVEGVTVDSDAETASFPVSHFSSYQVFRLLDPDAPFVLNATLEEYVSGLSADFVNRLAPYPAGGFDGGGPGLIFSRLTVQGLTALDVPGRPGSRAAQAIPVDSFVSLVAYRPSDERLYAVLGSQVFIVADGTLQLYAGANSSPGPSAGDDGPALAATFGQIRAITTVPDGLLVAELNRVRKVFDAGATSGNVVGLYGQSGGSTADGVDPATAGFQSIVDVETTGLAGDEVLIAEIGRVRLVGGTSDANRTLVGASSTLGNAAEDEALLDARFDGITSIAYDVARRVIYVADDFRNPTIYAADLDRDVVRRLAGAALMSGASPAGTAAPGVLDSIGELAVVDGVLVWSEGVNDRILFLDHASGNPF